MSSPTLGLSIAQPLLAPLVALNLWTFFMEGWLYYRRIPAISKYNIKISPTTSKTEFDKIPPQVRWPADNYNHLMEQPTQFYAVVLALVFLGVEDQLTVAAAWTYVGLRVVHSLIQTINNNIMVRFSIFAVSSFVALGLTVRAAVEVF